MRRVVSVWFPHWPTDRLRQSPDPARPVVTALHDGHRRVVGAVGPAAQALGLRPGMALAQAMAMVPGLTVQEGQPDADADYGDQCQTDQRGQDALPAAEIHHAQRFIPPPSAALR